MPWIWLLWSVDNHETQNMKMSLNIATRQNGKQMTGKCRKYEDETFLILVLSLLRPPSSTRSMINEDSITGPGSLVYSSNASSCGCVDFRLKSPLGKYTNCNKVIAKSLQNRTITTIAYGDCHGTFLFHFNSVFKTAEWHQWCVVHYVCDMP